MSGAQSQALLLTWLMELPVLFGLLRGLPWRAVLLAGLGASLLTHPVAWWAASLLSPHDHTRGLLTIELCVWVVEALVLFAVLHVRPAHALRAAGIANLVSFAVGAWLLA
jgi:hypothetical protein